jgi:hypothetical protein
LTELDNVPDGPSLDMVTAALRADSADVVIYARVLTKSLGEALPPEWVTVDWDRSMSDRMHGRPGQVAKITVRLGERVMTLGVQRGVPVRNRTPRRPKPCAGWWQTVRRPRDLRRRAAGS